MNIFFINNIYPFCYTYNLIIQSDTFMISKLIELINSEYIPPPHIGDTLDIIGCIGENCKMIEFIVH